jgi:hypothetical protein
LFFSGVFILIERRSLVRKMIKFLVFVRRAMAEEHLFKIPKLCFKISGFEGTSRNQRMIQCFLIASMAISGVFEFLFVVENLQDVLTSAEALAIFATAVLGVVKGLTFFFNLERVLDLMVKIEELNDKGLFV